VTGPAAASLYPFLSNGRGDLERVLEEVRRSTVAKAEEITALRRTVLERDGQRLFTLDDTRPYTRGHWGLRTTWSHLRIRRVSVTHL